MNMTRRGFLGSLLVLVAGPVVAKLAKALPAPEVVLASYGTNDIIDARFYTSAVVLNEDWLCFVHPSLEADIRDALYEDMRLGRGWFPGEIGRVENVRIIRADEYWKPPRAAAPKPAMQSLTLDLVRSLGGAR
jgi:hypothetical protein